MVDILCTIDVGDNEGDRPRVWIYVLVAVGVAIAYLLFTAVSTQRGYRLLFSDTHLQALVDALAPARSGRAETFQQVGLEWKPLKVHSALVIDTKQKLAPEALRFLMGVVLNATGREVTAALVLGPKRFALIIPGPVPSVVATDLAQWRSAGVAAMRELPIVPGQLAAYE